MTGLAALREDSESAHPEDRQELLRIISEKSLIRNRDIKLASGVSSRFYFDMKNTAFDPKGSHLIANLVLDALVGDKVDAIGGLEIGAVPIVACTAQRSHQIGRPIPGFLVRKHAKDHGTKQLIEPSLRGTETVVILDDVTTSGGSVLQAVEAVRGAGCTVTKVITVVDRQEGAVENLADHGLTLVPILTADGFDL